MSHSILPRLVSAARRALARVLAYFFGSLKFAWSPPPWLCVAGRGFAHHWRTSTVLLIVSAGVATGAWRITQETGERKPRIIVVAAATDATPAPSSPKPPAPATKTPIQPEAPAAKPDADVRDTSKPRLRAVDAHVNWPQPSWDQQRQKVTGPAIAINFSAPAAPLALLGKTAAAGTEAR